MNKARTSTRGSPFAGKKGEVGALIVALVILGSFWYQGNQFIDAKSPTFDEGVHLVAGYSYWKTGDFRVNYDDPPLIKFFWALPLYLGDQPTFAPPPELWDEANHWRIAQHFFATTDTPPAELFSAPRRINLGFGVLLVALIGWWGYRLWGLGAGLAAMAFAAVDPTMQAHSCVLSTDVGLTLFATLTFYLFWEYLRSPSGWLLTLIGLTLGLALGSKFSAIVIVVILIALVGIHLWRGGSVTLPHESIAEDRSFRDRLGKTIPVGVRLIVIALLTLVAIYWVKEFPTWGAGLKQQLARADRGGSFYFLGEVSSEGWLAYFPVAILIKTPIGTLLAIGLSLALFRWGQRFDSRSILFLGVPPLLYLAAMTYSGIDIGVRVVLPMFPFLFLIAGRLATIPRFGIALVIIPLALSVISVLRVTPHQLAYFNEAVGGPEEGWRYLGDSNLDWGQSLEQLHDYLQREEIPILYLSYYGTMEPEQFGIRYQYLPTFGRVSPPPRDTVPADADRHIVAVSATNRQGIYLSDPAMYRWLRERTPIAVLGYSMFIYDLTDDPDGLARLREMIRSTEEKPK